MKIADYEEEDENDNKRELPPMPKLSDFPMAFDSNFYNTTLYRETLAAWERICTDIISRD